MKKKLISQLLLVLLAVAALDGLLQFEFKQQYIKDQQIDISLRLSTLRAGLEKEITANLLLVQGTANFISVTPDMTREKFTNYAQNALEKTDLLKNIGAAPDFILRYVYPAEGNEAIVGVNYRDLPNQWEQVQQAALSGRMVVAGPLKLVQGGTGLIGRAPVFVFEQNKKRLWGVVSSVIDTDRLYQKIGLEREELEIALRGVNGQGENGAVFWGQAELFKPDEAAVFMPVNFPSGSWLIAGKPIDGWATQHPNAVLIHGLMGIVFLLTSGLLYRSTARNDLIEQARDNLNMSQAMAHLGSWEFNHVTETLWWSEEVYRIFRFSPGEINPTLEVFLSQVHPDDRKKVESAFVATKDSCSTHKVDHRIVCRDGAIRHVQERGSLQCNNKGVPMVSRGTILDITERVEAEQALKANEEQLRVMSEASHDALVMIDSEDRVLFWSRAAETMFGWSSEEALGQKMHLLIAPREEREQAWQGLEHFSSTGKGPVVGSVMEFEALKRDGSLIPVERSVSAFTLGGKYYAVGTLRDITNRKKTMRELRAYSDRLGLASQAGQIGVWEWDVEDNVLIWDEQMLDLYKFNPDEFPSRYEAWESRIHPEDRQRIGEGLRQAVREDETWEDEFRIVWPDDEVRYIKAAAVMRKMEDGTSLHLTGVNWDVTESRKTQEKLRLLATTDSLTGICNRRQFMELNGREIDRCRRYKTDYSLIMFDVDHFKVINDTYGHDVGDMVLKNIAQTTQEVLRDVDILGRIGGEEFAVGLPETDLEAGKLVAEKIRETLEKAEVTLTDGRTVTYTVSLGLAEFSEACSSVAALLKSTDIALYQAKKNGRNRVEFIESDHSCVGI